MDSLDVFFERQKVGELHDAPEGLMFSYALQWLEEKPEPMPISLSLPIKAEPQEAQAFFANLLPEGVVREYLCKNVFRLDYGDDFALLKAIGGDCAGALNLYPPGEGPHEETGGYHRLTASQFEEILQSPLIPQASFLREDERVRLSLAGAQDKMLIAEFDGDFFLPVNGAASTHIIKPQSVRLKGMVENEAYCMRLAQRMGLDVARSEIIKGFDDLVYKVARYDRLILGPQTVRRLHQEDFCQALGIGYASKYQEHNGPGLKECFELLRQSSTTPVPDRRKLLEMTVFNYLIGNTDCHAKNISLLYQEGRPTLAPAYDLVSGLLYPHFHQMAMMIGGAVNANQVEKENWERFAKDTSLRPRVVLGKLGQMAERIREEARDLAEEMSDRYEDTRIFEEISVLVVRRSEKTLRQLGIFFEPVEENATDEDGDMGPN